MNFLSQLTVKLKNYYEMSDALPHVEHVLLINFAGISVKLYQKMLLVTCNRHVTICSGIWLEC